MQYKELAPKQPEMPSTRDIIRLGEQLGSTLRHGEQRTLYNGEESLCVADEERLQSIVVTGDGTVLGIVKKDNMTVDEYGVEYRKVESVDIVVLPVGEASANLGRKGSSAVLRSVKIDTLGQPRSDGAVQPWETFSIGRSDVNRVTGANEYTEDRTMSRNHLGITIDSEGNVTVGDRSTNGTTVFSGDDIMRHGDERLAEYITKGLVDRPQVWQSDSRGHTVIYDAQ